MEYFYRIYKATSTILEGMGITMRHLLFEENVTIQFPEEKRKLPPRFRGALYNDIDACIICFKCAKACPIECITITATGKGKDRWCDTFDIDLSKCMWCELCVEACPDQVRSIIMTPEYEVSTYTRDNMLYQFGKGPAPAWVIEANKPKPKPAVKPAAKPAAGELEAKPAAKVTPKAEAKPAAEITPAAEVTPASDAKPKTTGADEAPTQATTTQSGTDEAPAHEETSAAAKPSEASSAPTPKSKSGRISTKKNRSKKVSGEDE